jgi:hypothetical protein
MSRIASLAAVGAVAAVAALPVAASASTSHAQLWQNKAKTVACGIEAYAPHHHAVYLLCSARGIPKPKKPEGCDPGFVQLAATGSPQPIETCQDQFQSQSFNPTTLAGGTKWTSLSITCSISTGKTITCTNKSKHGFTIGNNKYKSF